MGEVKHAFYQVYSETEELAAGTFQYYYKYYYNFSTDPASVQIDEQR